MSLQSRLSGLITVIGADIKAIQTTLATLGTAATKNTGTTSGTVPLLGTGGVLAPARIPIVADTVAPSDTSWFWIDTN